ncbi:inositol monophosphatase family protein [Limnofasciculus baicalensis]|uniref:inositol-phosphate phosphatase n=1 Tax=Limnofasciculus baicalensis BBK-W-15 TaxID=2699891 RepID=A0AAE3GZD4_9CYAN|nr:inositol monophosphatase family protein [Limnofasciculus baicalensis]MCP2732603.1 inositol monophosphatase family protein [Limnofasciculus baicalensis BBK-W-15]
MIAARRIALEAARLTLRWFPGPTLGANRDTSPHLETLTQETKGDGSPVTIADRSAETLVRERLAEAFPRDGVLGEEFGERAGTSEYRWVVDPIDGTVSFVHGVPLYGTILGLEKDGSPIGGVIVMPALNELVWGAIGLGSWHELELDEVGQARTSTPAKVSNTSRLSDATLVTTSLDYFEKARAIELYPRLQKSCAVTRGWSDCYGLVLVATGRADASVEPLMKPWDICGAVAIIEEAGGRCTDFAGHRRVTSGNAVVSNGALHDQLLAVVRYPAHT